jgi:hypothetical protein
MPSVERMVARMWLRGSHRTLSIDGPSGMCETLGMPTRNLRIVKLTPVAIGVCEFCNFQFHSNEPIGDGAELEIQRQFVNHQCRRLDEVSPEKGKRRFSTGLTEERKCGVQRSCPLVF